MNLTELLTVYMLTSQEITPSNEISNETANSLSYVIDNYFMKHSSSYLLIISWSRQNAWYYCLDLLNTFLYRDNMKVEIMNRKMMTRHTDNDEQKFNIMIVDSAESFIKINPASTVKNYDINEYYFILLQTQDALLSNDIQEILDYCWSNYLINVDILIQRATGDLVVYTYFPFAKSHCRKVVPVEINRYRNGKMDSEEIFPEKLLNMHQCPLKVALWNLPPFLSINDKKTGRDAIGGFEGELLKSLSDLMNFQIDSVVMSNNERGQILENETTGVIPMLQQKEVDMSMGFFVFGIARARMLTPTVIYHQSREIFVVLKESPHYFKPEVMTYPFSTNIWFMIIATFVLVLGILCWTITLFRRNSFDVASITLNNICLHLFAITLGMGSLLSPRRCYSKIIIATWMFGTLVLRTQYQALIYHLVRYNFYEHPPGSLEEVIDQDYTIIMNHLTYNALSSVPFFQEANLKVKMLNDINLGIVFSYMVENPDEKCVAVEPNEFFLYYGAQNRKAGVYSPLPQTMLVQSNCIYLTKHSFLINRVNDLLSLMSACGLITSWVNKALNLSYFKVPLEPKLSTIGGEQLKVAFYVCGMLLVLSFIVFILEILSVKCRTLKWIFDRM